MGLWSDKRPLTITDEKAYEATQKLTTGELLDAYAVNFGN